jgi:hypothetical protein
MPESTRHSLRIVSVGRSQKSVARPNTRRDLESRPASELAAEAGRYGDGRCLYMIVVGSRSGVSEARA